MMNRREPRILELGSLQELDWTIKTIYTEIDESELDTPCIIAGKLTHFEIYDPRSKEWVDMRSIAEPLGEFALSDDEIERRVFDDKEA